MWCSAEQSSWDCFQLQAFHFVSVYFFAFILLYLLLFWSLHIYLSTSAQGAATTPSTDQLVVWSRSGLRSVPLGYFHSCDLCIFLSMLYILRKKQVCQSVLGKDAWFLDIFRYIREYILYCFIRCLIELDALVCRVWGNTGAIFTSLGERANYNIKSRVSLKQSLHSKQSKCFLLSPAHDMWVIASSFSPWENTHLNTQVCILRHEAAKHK